MTNPVMQALAPTEFGDTIEIGSYLNELLVLASGIVKDFDHLSSTHFSGLDVPQGKAKVKFWHPLCEAYIPS